MSSNYVKRWKFIDAKETDPAYKTYVFPRNPREMESVTEERAVSSMTTTNGKVLLYEGATPARSWSFSGYFLHKTEADAMNYWVYHKRRRFQLIDHYGRTINLVLTSLDAVPKRRVGYYWSHDYTVNALVLSVTAPTITDIGPQVGD